MIGGIFSMLFGGGRNAVVETAEVFRVNAEKLSARDAVRMSDSLGQYGREFNATQRGFFDRFVDALNRLPRPAMALGTLALMGSAMIDPLWFASRMQGLALVPDPLWWLLAAVVSFYFGARYQAKGQEFQASIAQTLARTPQVVAKIGDIENLRPVATNAISVNSASDAGQVSLIAATESDVNPALRDWQKGTDHR